MTDPAKPLKTIGRAEKIGFPELHLDHVPARIDTGAATSAIWASQIQLRNGQVSCVMFDQQSPFYTGETFLFPNYDEVVVASSNGTTQLRYKVNLLVKIRGRKIRGAFTLANRATQVYPVLVGRNILRGKFLVDVRKGHPDKQTELTRSQSLQSEKGNR